MINGFRATVLLSFSTDEAYYSTGVYTSAMLFEMFLFGLYVALFGTCLHILLRNKRSMQKLILAGIVTMFLLAAADVVWGILNMHFFILPKQNEGLETRDDDDDDDDDDGRPEIPVKILQYKFLLYITSNIIADALLIYRCYILWNNKKRIIALPCFLLLGGTICGYLFVGMSDDEYPFRSLLSVFLFSTLALNSVVTSLMAGRIWWIAKRTRGLVGPKLAKKYRMAMAIFIESGLIYSIYVILDVVLHALLLDSGLVQVVGLVPTLIIVQTGLANSHPNAPDASTTNNLTTHKDETSTSLGNTNSRGVSGEFNYDLECQRNRDDGVPTARTSPIVIPAPPYRLDSVERYRAGYPASPSSDRTRVGEV
ncbi:hypothetical protein NP233_g1078 [Leucocoprinus birnbaumii]|uniref:Uncharacterized protein n=1 Tax=Leucocoprinus birnbaumii TaxID=56174 RepID=A0AAD5W384_9AGAR|nr:hypothetical protein NP233_g1078 [Leucocoprinus birnbaumii]